MVFLFLASACALVSEEGGFPFRFCPLALVFLLLFLGGLKGLGGLGGFLPFFCSHGERCVHPRESSYFSLWYSNPWHSKYVAAFSVLGPLSSLSRVNVRSGSILPEGGGRSRSEMKGGVGLRCVQHCSSTPPLFSSTCRSQRSDFFYGGRYRPP